MLQTTRWKGFARDWAMRDGRQGDYYQENEFAQGHAVRKPRSGRPKDLNQGYRFEPWVLLTKKLAKGVRVMTTEVSVVLARTPLGIGTHSCLTKSHRPEVPSVFQKPFLPNPTGALGGGSDVIHAVIQEAELEGKPHPKSEAAGFGRSNEGGQRVPPCSDEDAPAQR